MCMQHKAGAANLSLDNVLLLTRVQKLPHKQKVNELGVHIDLCLLTGHVVIPMKGQHVPSRTGEYARHFAAAINLDNSNRKAR